MKHTADPEEVRAWSRAARAAGERIGFVPTLGCLHAGHATLLRTARAENERVALCVFVNPFQFRRPQFEAYPRRLEADLALAQRERVDLAFTPDADAVYPNTPSLEALFALQDADEAARDDERFVVERPFGPDGLQHLRVPRRLVQRMDGEFFPWHFDAVATVVARLFELIDPDVAYFGEKDPQQLAILSSLAAQLPRRVAIRPVPVVRDPDGVPASSRNSLLSLDQRRVAAHASAALAHGVDALRAGMRATSALESAMLAHLAGEPRIELDYLGVVDPGTLAAPSAVDGSALFYVSFFVDGIRLTDSRFVRP